MLWLPSVLNPCEYLLRKLALISTEAPYWRVHFRLGVRSLLHIILLSSFGRGIIKQWLRWIFNGYAVMPSFQTSGYPNASYISICLDISVSPSSPRCSAAAGLLLTLSAMSGQTGVGNSRVSDSVIVLPGR